MLAEVDFHGGSRHVSYLELMLSPDGNVSAASAASCVQPDFARFDRLARARMFDAIVTPAHGSGSTLPRRGATTLHTCEYVTAQVVERRTTGIRLHLAA